MYYFSSSTIRVVGYVFNAGLVCPDCVYAEFGDSESSAEQALDKAAESLGIDRYDEQSFDSSDFPKVLFGYDVTSDDSCDHCHEPLD